MLVLFQVNVEDINDNAPVFEEPEYRSEVKESVAVGSTVTTVRATDLDSGITIFFSWNTPLQKCNILELF